MIFGMKETKTKENMLVNIGYIIHITIKECKRCLLLVGL